MKWAQAGAEKMSFVLYPLSGPKTSIPCNCDERCNFYFKMHHKLFGSQALPGPIYGSS